MTEPEYVFRKGEGWVVYKGPRQVKGYELKVGDKVVGWKHRGIHKEEKPQTPYNISKVTAEYVYHFSSWSTKDAVFHDVYEKPEHDPVEYFLVE